MNWHWLFEILEKEMPEENITIANPFKTRIIAEAQVKTDKIDAHILAQLLRANLVAGVHISSKARGMKYLEAGVTGPKPSFFRRNRAGCCPHTIQ